MGICKSIENPVVRQGVQEDIERLKWSTFPIEFPPGLVVETEDGKVIAYLLMIEKPFRTYVTRLEVRRGYRRMGIGSFLVRSLIKSNRDKDILVESCPDSVDFWKSLGFKKIGVSLTGLPKMLFS